jgi:hypothetical protein
MGEAERIKKLLEKLDELRKSGVLTEEEYAEKKDLLLKQLKSVERRPPPRIPQLLLVLVAAIIIFMGIFVAVTPVKVPVSYMTTAQTIAYIEFYTTLKVPIIEKASEVIKPGYTLAIRLSKYSLIRLPSSGTLRVQLSPATGGEVMPYRGYSELLSSSMTTFKSPTTTITMHLTDMIFEYGGKSYRFLKDKPMIVANVSVINGTVDFLLLDEKNYMKLMQQSSYQPIYVMSNIRGPSQFEFKPPSPDEIPGDEVYFAFLPKGGEGAEVQYEVNAVWEVIEKVPTTTTTTLYTTSEYVGAPLIETGISIILLGTVLLAIFIFWRTARR